MKFYSMGLGAVALAFSGAVLAADDAGGSLSTGYSYSSGKYGTANTTTIETIPFLVSLSYGDFQLDANVPYLNVSGDPNVIPGVGKVTNTNPKKRGNGAAKGSGSGLGDVVLSASYDFYTNEADKYGFDVTGSAKLGTGDKNQGLGTGATNYTVELGGYKSVGDLSFNASLGYTFVGSSNYVKLNKNVALIAVGLSYKVDEAWSVGANFDSGGQGAFSARVLRSVSGTQTREVMEYVAYKFSDSWKLQFYATEGLSTASPDFGGGAIIKLSF